MTPERWQRLEQLYHSALDQEPAGRDTFLADACAGDPDLRREVELLLDCDEAAGRFFAAPGWKAADALAAVRREKRIPPAQPACGEQLGPYRIVGMLGAGGMGEVYSAIDTRLERAVAIKLLPWEFSSDHQSVARFQCEARAASALNHPHICTIHDVGEHEGRPFFVMELIEGKSLKEHIAGSPMPVAELLDVAVQIAEGLEAAHAEGIVHRDIKPANILLTDGLQVKILDFGLAKRVADPHGAATVMPGAAATLTTTGATQRGTVVGTLAYLSPEQARGEEVDARTDIYSFGVVLYEMATGRRASAGETSAQVVGAILNETPAAPSELNPAIPAGLETIILKMLAKEPAARPQTAGEVLGALRKLRQTEAQRSRRTGRLAVGLGVMALAALAGLGTARWAHRPGGAPDLVQRQVTANPSNDSVYTAALSADGKQLAYADLEGVHIRTLDTGEVRHIVLPPGFCFR